MGMGKRIQISTFTLVILTVLLGVNCICYNKQCDLNYYLFFYLHQNLKHLNIDKYYQSVVYLLGIQIDVQLIVQEEKNPHNPFQSACRKDHGTEFSLLKLVNDLLGADNDKVSFLALLHLSAELNTLDHCILHRFQHSFGIHDVVLVSIPSHGPNPDIVCERC